MDSHGVPTGSAAAVTIGGIVFDNNLYDRDVDVPYLHVGDPANGVDAIGTEEGDGTFTRPTGASSV